MRWLLVVYFLTILASRLWIAFGADEFAPLAPGMERIAVVAYDGAGTTKSSAMSVELAFQTLGSDTGAGGDPVLLLHGSPGSLQDFERLASQVGPDRQVIVPDMLGFGASSRDVPDHSFVAQVDALIQLLDGLGLPRAHVVGFSWGGGVAAELVGRYPDRVSSLVMVSAIGVQELELLGRYELNHLVHYFQHAIVLAVDWGIPHFGALSRGPLGKGFTRSFLDSDQRPLRQFLSAWTGPTLIVHGRDDFLVPPAAAREHHRIVPQSELVWIDGGHLVLWKAPTEVAGHLSRWFLSTDRGESTEHKDASAKRLKEARLPFDLRDAGPQDGLGWVVFLLLVFAASMVSEDLTCAGVGLIVATGQVEFFTGVGAAIFALMLGDLVLYGGGRALGPPLMRRLGRGSFKIGPLEERLHRSGGAVVLLGRFVPGARLPTYVAAGILSYPIWRFTFWLMIAAGLWAPFLVGLTALAGEALSMEDASPRSLLISGGLLILGMALLARVVPQLLTWKGRRLVLARLRRLGRWEFWPIWAIYGPLAPGFLALMVRYGSVRLPTLVNAPIPGGGLAGESKAEIGAELDLVSEHAIATVVLEVGEQQARLASVEKFMSTASLGYPIVLKPDVGERGRGVSIVPDAEALERYLAENEGLTLAQAYVPGEEFGLFYVRVPGEEQGELFSVARKTPRHVVGNGEDNLERLILLDPICLPMAKTLLKLNDSRLEWIPSQGEHVPVTELATHSLGCRFLVGEDLRTPALETAVDRLSLRLALDFGRYDVRSPDESALRRGEFQVVEFNGLTGEAAHMYDPRYGPIRGRRILFEQWRRAFEVGAGHRTAGRKPLAWSKLARLVWTSRG